MSLAMDDEMAVDVDMDDLFGDSTGGLLPEANPPPKQLIERVEELRSGGCHQSITWSRQGCIASITSNGALEFQSLRIDPRDGSWAMSEPSLIPNIGILDRPSIPLQHLSWAPNGIDLAVVDTAGRVAIMMCLYLNKPVVQRPAMQDPVDELHSVVGTHWLNPWLATPRQTVVHNMAVKTSSQGYRYEPVQAQSFGPSYPVTPQTRGKSALLCLTSTGVLRLFWVQENSSWRETTAEIDNVVSSDDLITHASMCADKDRSLLLAYATSTEQLRVVRIAIQWTVPPVPNKKDQTPQPQKSPTNVAIKVTHLTSTNWMDARADTEYSHLSPATPALSHLKMLSPCSSEQQGVLYPPTIVTVRTHLSSNSSYFDQEVHSMIERWELKPNAPRIHQAFQNLNARRDSVGSKKTSLPAESVFLNKMDSVSSKKVLTWIEIHQLERILALGYGDGSVEFVDRQSLENISDKGGLDKFCHLTQVGFRIEDVEPSTSAALSSSGVAVAYKANDGKVKWKGLVPTYSDINSPRADTRYTAFIAGLAMPAFREVLLSAPLDDILAVASCFKWIQGRDTALHLVSEISKNLGFLFEFSEDQHHESLINNHGVQLSLGLMLGMGYNGEARPRDFAANIAWMTLHMRHSVMMLAMLNQTMRVPALGSVRKISGLEDPEALRLIVGTVRWSLDLMSWIVDCLIHPNDPDEFDETFSRITKSEPEVGVGQLNLYLRAKDNIALHLLLASTTRGFLTALCRRLHHLDFTARAYLEQSARSAMAGAANGSTQSFAVSSSLRAAYMALAQMTAQSPVPYPRFEKFIASISGNIKEAYVQAGVPVGERNPQSRRNQIEQRILFGQNLPQELQYAITKIFHEDLPALKEEIDPAQLFFHDYSVLNIPEQDRSTSLPYFKSKDPALQEKMKQKYVRYRVRHTVDVFQRKPVELGKEPEVQQQVGGRRWRRCVRCAAVMEDVITRDLCVGQMISTYRRCACAGLWNIMTGKRTIP